MSFIAHISNDKREQTVYDHCKNVADIASDFAIKDFISLVKAVSMAHDIGKFSKAFQNRIKGKNIKFEHSICGAIEYHYNFKNSSVSLPLIEYCIAGHHSGLPDGSFGADNSDSPTLTGRLMRKDFYTGDNDYSDYKKEMSLESPDLKKLNEYVLGANKIGMYEVIEQYAFFTRYVYSCLVDADFIDTERFCDPEKIRGICGDFKKALDILNTKLEGFTADTPVKRARAMLQKQALLNSQTDSPIHILNMPTGSGKTLCSLKIALEKAVSKGKKRIIYIIPYTSIIEQTSNQFENLFKEVLPVLQHHSNYDFDSNEDETTAEKLKRTSENWDAPLIVATSVQFFESLYHNKSSKLRKLHNLADSVLVFDEIHLIPTEYIQPCMRGIGYITKYLNSEAIFLSATMPDYSKLISEFLTDITPHELIVNKSDYKVFSNCTYSYIGKINYESVVIKAINYKSILIIVNKKKTAQMLYNLIEGKKYHLSAYMTPAHRSKMISKIKEALKRNEKIAVVSTSLVEAGVDFDFETVFREMTGLDSILQSGGRCNREGIRSCGNVFIFETDEKPQKDLQIKADITKELIKKYEDISCTDCIEEYYSILYSYDSKKINRNSIYNFNPQTNNFDTQNNKLYDIPFKSYAQKFEYIKSETQSVVINDGVYNCCGELIGQLKLRNLSVKRKLQKYSVSLYNYEIESALKLGIIEENNGVFVLTNNQYYSAEKGFEIYNIK